MEISKNIAWVYYQDEDFLLNPNKCGKWMYFFTNMELASRLCKDALAHGIVRSAKHSNKEEGVMCFYLECDDYEGHKRVIEYFLQENLIKRTKKGRLYNIPFKLDNQTRAGIYGGDFKSDIKLDNFIDLDTGACIFNQDSV